MKADLNAEFLALHAFQRVQWAKLHKHEGKGSWKEVNRFELLRLLKEEVKELEEAMLKALGRESNDNNFSDHIAEEAADVANFAMMIADVYGGLR